MESSKTGLLPSVLVYSALASFANGALGHGIFFVLKELHGFSDQANLLFALAMYAPYVPAAYFAGHVAKRFGDRASLLCAIVSMALCTGLLALNASSPACWILVPLYNMMAGLQWPLVESYLTSRRHGSDMRRTIGLWNMTWATTMCLALGMVGYLLRNPTTLFLIFALTHVLTLMLVGRWPKRIPAHDQPAGADVQRPSYRPLLKSCQALLFLVYVLNFALTPLLPGVWIRLHVDLHDGAYLSSTWLVGRIVPFIFMYLFSNWQGRWLIPLGAGLLFAGGFAIAVTGTNTAMVVAGLFAFGLGHGMAYYATLYYRMSVGCALVESGGKFEALIGLGYCVGPAVALTSAALWSSNPGAGMLGGLGVLAAISMACAVRPFVRHVGTK